MWVRVVLGSSGQIDVVASALSHSMNIVPDADALHVAHVHYKHVHL